MHPRCLRHPQKKKSTEVKSELRDGQFELKSLTSIVGL